MNKELFGRLSSGEEVYAFTLVSGESTARIINYGATITSFCPFGSEIVAGFDTIEDYERCRSYHGTTVGRVANRIVNAKFPMDGEIIELGKNNGEHCLHGGPDGYSKKLWCVIDYGKNFVKLGYFSPDGESGFPSDLDVEATFTLKGACLGVKYKAIPHGKTPIMLTTHGFFNLDSFEGDVLGHEVTILADQYTEVDDNRLPTGNHVSVDNTAFDFRMPRKIGERINESPIGYDNNYILSARDIISNEGTPYALAAQVKGKRLVMTAYTNQPGIQFYVQNSASETAPKLHGRRPQFPKCAFCIEPQLEPNCVNHGLGFYDVGEVYEAGIIYEVERLAETM